MKLQRNCLVLAMLLSSFGSTLPADTAHTKAVGDMSVREIAKLDPQALTGQQKLQLFHAALFSGLEHKQLAARKALNKLKELKISDWNSFKQKVIQAGLEQEAVKQLKDSAKRNEIIQSYKDAWFSGLQHKKQKAQKLLQSKGFKVDDKLREKVINSGLKAALSEKIVPDVPGETQVVEEEEREVWVPTEEKMAQQTEQPKKKIDQGKTQVVEEEEKEVWVPTKEKMAQQIELPKKKIDQGETQVVEEEEILVPANLKQIIITLPEDIQKATNMASVTLQLDDPETLTQETFRELINRGSNVIVTLLSHDIVDDKWYAHDYDASAYAALKIEADETSSRILDPITRFPVQYEHYTTVTDEYLKDFLFN